MLVQTMWEGFLKGKSYREREQFTTFTYVFQQAHGGGGLLTGNTLKGRSYWQWLSTTETSMKLQTLNGSIHILSF